MDVHPEPQIPLDRRAGFSGDRRGRAQEVELSEHDLIEAAQFMLGTRQREEALLRSTHLRGGNSMVSESRARETLSEMLHLQERITARAVVPAPARGGRRRRDTIIDLDTRQAPASRRWRRGLFLMLVLAGVVAASVVVAAQQQLF